MRHFLLISAFVFLCCATLHAQNRYFPLRGKVVSADSLSPIPNVHILSEISYYGTTSDFDGRFSMQIRRNDSLRVSSIGFVTKMIAISYDSIDANNYEIVMERDTIMLQDVDVFPYIDYYSMQKIIREMPTEKPFVIKGVNDNIEKVIWQKPRENPKANIIQNPIQSLYNRFNKKERLKRKLEKNRRKYGAEEEWR